MTDSDKERQALKDRASSEMKTPATSGGAVSSASSATATAVATSSSGSRTMKRTALVLFFFAAAAIAMIVSLVFGSADITMSKIWDTLWASKLTDTQSMVIWNIRLPRNIVAALVGANLAVAGAILQAVMKNPLADPQIVGVSSGAGLAGVIILILYPGFEY